MPFFARTIGLILVVVGLACPIAQPTAAGADQESIRPAWAESPSPPPSAPALPSGWQSGEVQAAAYQAPLPPTEAKEPRAVSPPRPSKALPPPGRSQRGDGAKASGVLSTAITIASSLAMVLGLFFLVVWAMRRASPAGATLLPSEVLEVLGRASLAHRQQVYLLRCGKKLLLVSVTPAGAETLGEIVDPPEVDRLAGLCRQAHPQSATAAFRQVLEQWQGPWEKVHA